MDIEIVVGFNIAYSTSTRKLCLKVPPGAVGGMSLSGVLLWKNLINDAAAAALGTGIGFANDRAVVAAEGICVEFMPVFGMGQ